MSPTALGLVLSAAVLHAVWNALIKSSVDRAFTMGLINFGHGILGLAMVLAFLPPAPESWPFIAASTVIHFFYYVFLVIAYRHGDLSQVYPIARGVAPLLVALGGFAFAGEVQPLSGWLGIALVSFGIGLLVFGKGVAFNAKAVIAALLTGFTIAAYSVADGLGVRAADGAALGYIGWLFFLEFIAGVGFMIYRRSVIRTMPARIWVIGLTGGVISALAYGLAIYAKQLAPLGAVSAVRESSVIIAALIGTVMFGERPWKPRIVSAVIVAAGVVFLAIG